MTIPDARVTSVNVGRVAQLETPRGTVASAIVKQPAHGRVRLEGINAAGDDQADRSVHGGVDRAVYAYAAEDYAWWEPSSADLSLREHSARTSPRAAST
ncbi:MAG: hypothetical protein JWM87_236 [Candidatus Eremiobacteraeota bacterium]|nr:hypothetical protein [Candidatus Eremiobacteraeota bacterium]